MRHFASIHPARSVELFRSGFERVNPLFVQFTGALYLGFAIMNWMAKTVLIGGIYARPLAIGNFAHFTVGGLALLKYAFSNSGSTVVWIVAIAYSLFAILFGVVFLTHPLKTKTTDGS